MKELSKTDYTIGTCILGVTLCALISSFDGGIEHHRIIDTGYVSNKVRRLPFSGGAGPKKRLALIRPFAPGDDDGQKLLDSFDLWDDRWPCSAEDNEYDVDLVLSYSRSLNIDTEDAKIASDIVNEIRSKFIADEKSGGYGWSECFVGMRIIEANLDPSRDKYFKNSHTGSPESLDWVTGPNGQFRADMSNLMEVPEKNVAYEVAMIMEADNQPMYSGWLDEVVEDVEDKTPFAILGSKYKGNAWEGMERIMPSALLNHINGNAVYNLTHPYFKLILNELKLEAGSEYEAISYDYRISQIVHEGAHGSKPQFPFRMTNQDGTQVELKPKKEKFTSWWDSFGVEQNPIKESSVILNFGESNYLRKHVKGTPALVHGLNLYKDWNPYEHQISLVVSAWDDHSHHDLLSELDKLGDIHPFQEVLIMKNSQQDHVSEGGRDVSDPNANVPFTFQERVKDLTDICDAQVTTEWFFHTNVYYRVADKLDLLFTDEYPVSRPVVPYTPAESIHCQEYDACRETLRLAREIYPEMDKVVLDMNIPIHTPSRDAFCQYWRQTYGHGGETLEVREGGRKLALSAGVPLTPTATSYVAYLYQNALAEKLYHFTNVLVHGSKPLFTRIKNEDVVERQLEETTLEASNRQLENIFEPVSNVTEPIEYGPLYANLDNGLVQLDLMGNDYSGRPLLVDEVLTKEGSFLISPDRKSLVYYREDDGDSIPYEITYRSCTSDDKPQVCEDTSVRLRSESNGAPLPCGCQESGSGSRRLENSGRELARSLQGASNWEPLNSWSGLPIPDSEWRLLGDPEPLACTYANGGEKCCAGFLDTPSCGICAPSCTATREDGKVITISEELGVGVAGKLGNFGLTVGATWTGTITITSNEIVEQTIDENLVGLTGKHCLRYQITKFTLQKWKKEYRCILRHTILGPQVVTYFRWVPTAETADYEIATGYCDEKFLDPCTTTSPTVSPTFKPTTPSPTTASPTTKNPTGSPTTDEPTGSPTTKDPTGSPTTDEPTGSPTTKDPTGSPTTDEPTTSSPTTASPTTSSPTTSSPTTSSPTTDEPSVQPVTGSPSKEPATHAPFYEPTVQPVTGSPSKEPTVKPVTGAPSPKPSCTGPYCEGRTRKLSLSYPGLLVEG